MKERTLRGTVPFATAAVALAGAATALGAFGTGGKTIVNAGGTNSADDVAIAKDGKIVGVGAAVPGSDGFDFAAVRLTSAGTPDSMFSGDGKQTTSLGGFDTLDAVVVQKDLAIVAGGSSDAEGAQQRATLIRYEPDGDPDPTFSDDGIKIYSLGGGFSDVEDLELQRDGKVVIAGTISPGGEEQDAMVARVKANGKVDRKFGRNGFLKFGVKKGTNVNAAAIQKNGRIVIAGDTSGASMDSKSLQLIARVTEDGKLDRSFSGDGIYTRKLTGLSSRIEDVAIAKDGGVVGAVGVFGGLEATYGVTAVKENGKRNRRFGKKGIALRDFGDDTTLRSVAVQSSGAIVAAGGVRSGDLDFLLTRFTKRGKLDESFGFKGATVTDFAGGSSDLVQALALAKDDTILAAGFGDSDFGFARYSPDGELDD